jgi:hypothetical protein
LASFDLVDAWKKFENELEDYYPFNKFSILSGLAKYYDSQKDVAKVEEIKKELKLLNKVIAFSNEIPDVWKWCIDNLCQPFPEWRVEDLDYYKIRFQETPNTLNKARYAYAVWTLAKSEITYAQSAVENFFETAKKYVQATNDASYSQIINMCFELGLSLSLTIEIRSPLDARSIFKEIFSSLESQYAKKNNAVTGSLIDLISRCGSRLLSGREFKNDKEIQDIISNVIEITEEIVQMYELEGNYETALVYITKQIDLWSALGNDVEARRAKVYLGDSMVKIEEKSSLRRSYFLQMALKQYSEAGVSDKVKELSIKIQQETQRAIRDGEFKEISISSHIAIESAIDQYSASLFGKKPEEILSNISADDDLFIPRLDTIRQRVEDLRKAYRLPYIIPSQEYSESIPSRTVINEDEIFEMNVDKQFLVDSEIRLQILGLLLSKFIGEHIQKEDLIVFLTNKKNIEVDNLKFVCRALDNYFEGDYVSFCHVIMPRIEHEMRKILNNKGATTAFYDPTDQGLDIKAIGGLILALRPYVNKNLHKYLEVWYTQKGQNLRNRISHGWMELSEFDKKKADLLLYTLIKLSDI